MENFFYLLIFVAFAAVKYFFDKKVKEIDLAQIYKAVKPVARIHKQVRNKQKFYRRANKKYPAAVSVVAQDIRKEIYGSSVVTHDIVEQKTDVFSERKYIFGKKTLKDAVVFKEILDLPVALRQQW